LEDIKYEVDEGKKDKVYDNIAKHLDTSSMARDTKPSISDVHSIIDQFIMRTSTNVPLLLHLIEGSIGTGKLIFI